MGTIIIILLIFGLILLWQDFMKSREHALLTAVRACQEIGVQLLDQTVSMDSMKIKRNAQGRLVWRRVFSFDFSMAGDERRRGSIQMLGLHVQQVQLDTDEGALIEGSTDDTSI